MDPLGNPLFHLIQELLPWFSILLDFAGAAVAGTYLGRSRWVRFILAAFLADGTFEIASRVVVPILARTGRPSIVPTYFLVATVLGIFIKSGMVIGLAGVLSDGTRAAGKDPQARDPGAPR